MGRLLLAIPFDTILFVSNKLGNLGLRFTKFIDQTTDKILEVRNEYLDAVNHEFDM